MTVAKEFEQRSVQLRGAALGDHAHHAAARLAVLRIVRVGDDLHFLHRVGAGRDQQRTPVAALRRHAVDQQQHGLIPSAIHREPALILIARRGRDSRANRRDSGLRPDQVEGIPISAVEWKVGHLGLVERHLPVSGLRIDLQNRALDLDGLRHLSELHADIQLGSLARRQRDALHIAAETLHLGRQLVGARQQLRNRIAAGIVAGRAPLLVRRGIFDFNRSVGNRRLVGIGHQPRDVGRKHLTEAAGGNPTNEEKTLAHGTPGPRFYAIRRA